LIADYYLIRKQKVVVDDLFTMDKGGKYWYSKGYNRVAVLATVVAATLAVIPVLLGGSVAGMHTAAQYSWFIGCGVAFVVYYLVARRDALVAESVS
jgi:NCS1 family nucleobase:cation symporter-1